MTIPATRLALLSAILFVVTLVVPRGAAAAPPDDTARWSNLGTVPSGTAILVTARDGRVFKRTMVLVEDTRLVTIDLGRLPAAVDTSMVSQVVREAPDAVGGTATWHANHLTVLAGVVREDGRDPLDLRPALDRFESRDVALVARPAKPGSKLATIAAGGVGLLLGSGFAFYAAEIRCQPDCGAEKAMVAAGLALPVGASLAAYYATRRGERILYRAPAPARQPGIDEAMWERIRRGLPASFRGTGDAGVRRGVAENAWWCSRGHCLASRF